MVEGLLSVIFPGAGAIAGAVGGLLTKGVSSWFNGRKEEKQAKIETDRLIQLERIKAENAIKISEQTGHLRVKELEQQKDIADVKLKEKQEETSQEEARLNQEEEKTLRATIEQQDKLTGHVHWSDIVIKVMRPIIVLFCAGMIMYLLIDDDTSVDVRGRISISVVMMFEVVFGWWFAMRPQRK